MRCILGLCAAAFPIATAFTARAGVHPLATAAACREQHSKDRIRQDHVRHRTSRRYSGENLDSSDDADDGPDADAEIYASLRRRLEELEKSSPVPPAAADRVEA